MYHTACYCQPSTHHSFVVRQQRPTPRFSLPVSVDQDAPGHTPRNMSLLDVQSEQLAIKLQKEADNNAGIIDIAAIDSQSRGIGIPASTDVSALGKVPSTAQSSKEAAQVSVLISVRRQSAELEHVRARTHTHTAASLRVHAV